MAARVLGRHPEGDAVGHDVRGGVHRLHARVLEKRHLVDGLDDLAAGAQRLLGVALVARHLARLPGHRLVLLADRSTGERGQGALVPRDLERAAALQRRPEVGGDDGDAVADLHDVADARHGLGGRGVEGLHLAAEYRAALDRGDQHARHLHVHAVDRPAVGLDRDVEAGDAFLADVAELVLRLQHRVLRHRQLRGFVHELPVHQSSSTRTMNDDTRLRFQLALRNVPLLRGGLLQHLAGGGAGLAPHLEVVAHAAAAAVGLVAGDGVRVELGVGRRLLDPDLAPVGVELVGDDHRRRGHGALAHLGHRVRDRHDAIAIDLEPLVGREDAGRLLRGGVQREAEADDEAGAERGAALEERATGDLRVAVHRVPAFFIAAALWIAARIRW